MDHFTLCCHVEKSLPNVICKSLVGNGVSSCDELLKNKVLTYCIWVLGVTALVGNLVVMLLRIIGNDVNRVNSFLLVGNRLHSLDPNSARGYKILRSSYKILRSYLLEFYNRRLASFLIGRKMY